MSILFNLLTNKKVSPITKMIGVQPSSAYQVPKFSDWMKSLPAPKTARTTPAVLPSGMAKVREEQEKKIAMKFPVTEEGMSHLRGEDVSPISRMVGPQYLDTRRGGLLSGATKPTFSAGGVFEVMAYNREEDRQKESYKQMLKRSDNDRYWQLRLRAPLFAGEAQRDIDKRWASANATETEIWAFTPRTKLAVVVTSMKFVNKQQAQDILLKAAKSKITWTDVSDITAGRVTSGAKYEAFKDITSHPAAKQELSFILKGKKVPLKTKVYDYFKEALGMTDDLIQTKFKQPTPKALPSGEKLPVKTITKTIKTSSQAFEWPLGVVPVTPEKVAGQYVPWGTDKLSFQAVKLINKDIVGAENLVKNKVTNSAIATAGRLCDFYSKQAAIETVPAMKDALHDKAAELAVDISARLIDKGKTIQAAAITSNLSPEAQVRFAAKTIENYNAKAKPSKQIPKLTAEQETGIIAKMNEIDTMPIKTPKEMAIKATKFQQLQDEIFALVPSPMWNKIMGIRKAGMLTGLKTSGLNLLSNTAHLGLEYAKDYPAYAVDSAISLFTKQKTIGLPTIKGTAGGVKEGFIKGSRYMRTGYDERNIRVKLDWNKVNYGSSKAARAIQIYEQTIFRWMGSMDQPFYYGAKARSIVEQARGQASNKGLHGKEAQALVDKLIANPTDKMIEYAALDAEIAVYQNKTVLGDFAKAVQKVKPGGVPIGEIAVPFGRTPSAVATQVINYSPVGMIKTVAQNIGKDKFDQRLFSQGIGRNVIGTLAWAVGGYLWAKGNITLGYPEGEREQKLWEAEGKKPYAVKIGGKWRSVESFGPFGTSMIMGGYLKEAYQKAGSPTGAMVEMNWKEMSQAFLDQTFIRSLKQGVDAISSPDRYGEGYLGSLLSSTVPTLVGDFAKVIDKTERRTSGIIERLQARVPVWRNALEPRITVLGEEKPRPGNWLETMIDPTRPVNIIETPLILELRRMTDAGYKVSPTLLGNRDGYPALTKEQNTRLWKRTGQLIKGKLENLIEHEAYKKATDEDRAETIDNFIGQAKTVARAEFAIELTEGLEGEALRKRLGELKAGGLITASVYKKYLELR